MTKYPNSYPIRTRINIRAFIKKYLKVMPEDMFIELSKMQLNGGKFATINTTAIFDLHERLNKQKSNNNKK